jgi:hypothetical protein
MALGAPGDPEDYPCPALLGSRLPLPEPAMTVFMYGVPDRRAFAAGHR